MMTNLIKYTDFTAVNNPERGNWNDNYRFMKINDRAKRRNQKKMRGL